jgi:hypothetical protein
VGFSSSIQSERDIFPFYLSLLNLLIKDSISNESGWALCMVTTIELRWDLYASIILYISYFWMKPWFIQSIWSKISLEVNYLNANCTYYLKYSTLVSTSIELLNTLLKASLVSKDISYPAYLNSTSSRYLKSIGKRAFENSQNPKRPS